MINLSTSNNEIGNTYSSIDSNIYEDFQKNGDGEIFEKLVMDLMLNKYSDDTEVTEYILSLPIDKQRLAIMSLIDGDNNLWSKMNSYVNECSDKMEHIKDVVKIINKFVKDGEVDKKKFGEVMTPIKLVREMLDTLPKEVWSNPDLKWLDPANGAGTFPFVIIYKLMIGLIEWEPDTEKRYKHIVENMIYTCELQSRNVFLWLCGVDPKDEYTTNTYWGSFLDEGFDYHMKNVWGLDGFDIIVMNPPYQELKKGNKKSQALWDKFVIKTLDDLVEGGYLVAVHPDGWRGITKDYDYVQKLLKSKQITYLEMHNIADGFETFGANTTYDFYCLHNVPNTMFTKIKCTDGKIERLDLSKMVFIPNVNIEFVFSLLANDGEERVNILHSYSNYETRKEHMSREETEEFKYPCAYTVGSKNPNFFYSNKKGKFFEPKVVWGNGLTDVIIDETGKYGLTQFTYAIADNVENLKHIQTALKSEKFKKDVMGYTKGVGHIYNRKIISLFRKNFWLEFI